MTAAVSGLNQTDVASRVNNLGLVFMDLGDLAEARAAFERALGVARLPAGPLTAGEINASG